MCHSGECSTCQVLRGIDDTEPAFTEVVGTCACGGDLKPFFELHTLTSVTQHLRCTSCQVETTRTLPAEAR